MVIQKLSIEEKIKLLAERDEIRNELRVLIKKQEKCFKRLRCWGCEKLLNVDLRTYQESLEGFRINCKHCSVLNII